MIVENKTDGKEKAVKQCSDPQVGMILCPLWLESSTFSKRVSAPKELTKICHPPPKI
jgi:hypothetical protein